MAHPWLMPYSAQFQLSVEQLEQRATKRQFRKKPAQHALATQAQPKAHRVRLSQPAAASNDLLDLLYTSVASPSCGDHVGASVIVSPLPVAALIDAEPLTVNSQSGPDTSGGKHKSRGYRHTIRFEYDPVK
ncbi:hypothetical protein FRC06_008162 [Ceratobasidium sp. 370]|nr:hypothetical protein FRC06_008162 [Ceratobasidium sp. 370]